MDPKIALKIVTSAANESDDYRPVDVALATLVLDVLNRVEMLELKEGK